MCFGTNASEHNVYLCLHSPDVNSIMSSIMHVNACKYLCDLTEDELILTFKAKTQQVFSY